MLDVWRQACLEPRVELSARAIATVVARRLPCERLLIRALDPEGQRIETIAEVGPGPEDPPAEQAPPAPNPAPPAVEALRRLCLGGEVLRGEAATLRGRLPGLIPRHWAGPILAGGLTWDQQALGVLVLGAGGTGVYGAEHEPMLAALREPIAVALRNDRQLRELNALREAAEADRRSLLVRLGRQDIADTIVGEHTGLEAVMRSVDLVARAESPVLILGETGTGKEIGRAHV